MLGLKSICVAGSFVNLLRGREGGDWVFWNCLILFAWFGNAVKIFARYILLRTAGIARGKVKGEEHGGWCR